MRTKVKCQAAKQEASLRVNNFPAALLMACMLLFSKHTAHFCTQYRANGFAVLNCINAESDRLKNGLMASESKTEKQIH